MTLWIFYTIHGYDIDYGNIEAAHLCCGPVQVERLTHLGWMSCEWTAKKFQIRKQLWRPTNRALLRYIYTLSRPSSKNMAGLARSCGRKIVLEKIVILCACVCVCSTRNNFQEKKNQNVKYEQLKYDNMTSIIRSTETYVTPVDFSRSVQNVFIRYGFCCRC